MKKLEDFSSTGHKLGKMLVLKSSTIIQFSTGKPLPQKFGIFFNDKKSFEKAQ